MARETRSAVSRAAVEARQERHAVARAAGAAPVQCDARGMTPVAAVLFLELAGAQAPVACGDSPARMRAWSDFRREGLLREGVPLLVPPGSLTEKGLAHLNALSSLPLPVAVTHTVWLTPKEGDKP